MKPCVFTRPSAGLCVFVYSAPQACLGQLGLSLASCPYRLVGVSGGLVVYIVNGQAKVPQPQAEGACNCARVVVVAMAFVPAGGTTPFSSRLSVSLSGSGGLETQASVPTDQVTRLNGQCH